MTHAYDDIIHLPHPESKRHPRMSLVAGKGSAVRSLCCPYRPSGGSG